MQKLIFCITAIVLFFSSPVWSQKGYCESSATDTGFEFISNVKIGSIDNSTESNGYQDFTSSLTTSCYLNETYVLEVTTDIYSPIDKLAAWVDWNQNQTFEDNEKIDFEFSGIASKEGFGKANLSIPADALMGNTVIRIVLQETEEEILPCGTYYYGETEDYTLNIIAVTEVPTVNFTLSKPQVFINETVQLFDASSNAPTQWEWTITPNNFEFINGTSETSKNPELKMLAAGSYAVTLKATNLIGTSTLTKNEFIQVKNFSAPKNLTAFPDANRVVLNWEKPNLPDWKGYLVDAGYCDGATWAGKERATFYDDADFDFSYPLTLSKLAHGFYMLSAATWPDNKFAFKIYGANGLTLIYESPVLEAQHNKVIEHQLTEIITLIDDFYVAVAPVHSSGQPSSLYSTQAAGLGHSFLINEGKLEVLGDSESSYELFTQIYIANDAKNKKGVFPAKNGSKDQIDLLGYRLFRNNEMIQEFDSPEILSFEDTPMEDGEFTYYLKALYTNHVTSGKSNQVTTTVDNTGGDILLTQNDAVVEINDLIKLPANVNLGETKDLVFTINNPGGANLIIDTLKLDNSTFTVTVFPDKIVPSKGTTSFTIQFKPETDGPQNVNASILSNDANENPFTFQLKGIGGQDAWTWMIYLLEDGTGLDGRADINEWEANGSMEGEVNYLVLYDAQNDERDGIYWIKKDENGNHYDIVSERIDESFGVDFDMSDWHTLSDFLMWTKDNYPAKNYGLTMWDHGAGIFKSTAADKAITKDFVGGMKLWEIDKALKVFTDAIDKKMAIVGFDVCLLGQIETAYQIKDYTDYVIASELTEPGDGWDYEAAFKVLNDNPQLDAKDLAISIVDTYVDSYLPGGSSYVSSSTQAATSTQILADELVPALNNLCTVLISNMLEYEDEIREARNNCWAAPHVGGDGEDNPNHRDLGGFLQRLTNNNALPDTLIKSAEKCLQAYEKTVVAEGHSDIITDGATGLKIFIPQEISKQPAFEEYYTNTSKYLTFAETQWDEFLYAFETPGLFALPMANFEADSLHPTMHSTVAFTDLSLGNPTQWAWTIEPASFEYLDGSGANSQHLRIKFTEEGTYSVSLKASNSNGSNTTTFKNYISVQKGASIFETRGVATIYPNPSRGLFTINSMAAIKSVEVFNIQGNKVDYSLEDSGRINIADEADGIYFIKISTQGKVNIYKLVKNSNR